jgi:hypothetical protein
VWFLFATPSVNIASSCIDANNFTSHIFINSSYFFSRKGKHQYNNEAIMKSL